MPVPGQPLILHQIATNARFGSSATAFFTDITNRCHSPWSSKLGQQYQRSQAQAGTFNATYRNNDGYLDPENTASPYVPFTEFCQIRIRAQYPGTRNLLLGDQANAGETSPIAPGPVPSWMSLTAWYATPNITASATAWQGTQVFSVAVAGASPTGHELLQQLYVPVQSASPASPATQYAWSVYVRSATSGANPTVTAQIQWLNSIGGPVSNTTSSAVVLTGSTTAAWTRLTLTGTPPAGATCANLAVMLSATAPAGAWSFQADGLQFEILQPGTVAATAWVQPGAWYGIWAGGVVGAPRAYVGDGVPGTDGNYSVAKIAATDAIGAFAQARLQDAYISTLMSYGPNWLYPLTDPAAPYSSYQAWQDWTGQRGTIAGVPYTVNQTGYSYQPGTGSTGTPDSNGLVVLPAGIAATSVTLSLAARYYDSGPSFINATWVASGVNLAQPTLVGPPPLSGWSRIMAFQMSPVNSTYKAPVNLDNGAPQLRCCLFAMVGPAPSGFPQVSLSVIQNISWSGGVPTYGTPFLFFEAWTSVGTYVSSTLMSGAVTIDTSSWWLASVSLSADGTSFGILLGNAVTGAISTYTVATGGPDFRASPGAYVTDTYGCWWAPWQASSHNALPGNEPLQYGMNGQLGAIAEFGYPITGAQFTDMFTAWRTAYAGDSPGTRVNRVAGWAGWSAPVTVDTGTAPMGAAGGMGSSTGPYSGTNALSVLQNVALAEHGMIMSGTDGTPTFRSRSSRFAQGVPAVVFGEGPPVGAAGEIPYLSLEPGHDLAEVINSVVFNVTSGAPGATSVPISASNPSSVAAYYSQPVQQTLNTSTGQAANLAQWLVGANSQPRSRVSSLRVDAARVAGAWPALLGLSLDRLIQVNRRPLGGNPLTIRAFTENIAWNVDPSKPSAVCTIQGSAALLDAPWMPAAMHTTLSVQANSGTNTITITALPQASTTPLQWLLPTGYQLTLDPANPALAETVTVAPNGIPATTAGWTTATITLTANLTHTHAAGAVVCEALPSGVTDPTVYDWRSMPAAAVSTVAGGGAAGTNTITITALPDAPFNQAARAIPRGWQFYLSPGTGRFEVATVAPNGIPVTAPGWQTVTLTLAGNLLYSHPVGDIVCDTLPTGMTNPAAVNIAASTLPGF